MAEKLRNMLKLYDRAFNNIYRGFILEDITEYLKISTRTISRYIEDLKLAGADLKYNKKMDFYYLGDYISVKKSNFPDLKIKKLNRLLEIYIQIYHSNGMYFTFEWYNSKFGMSKRTLSRDIHELNQSVLDIEYDRSTKDHGFYRCI